MNKIYAFLIILWWGILISIGFIVVPLLFKSLPTAALAGNTAALFFKIVNYLSMTVPLIIYFGERSAKSSTNKTERILRTLLIAAFFGALFSQFIAMPHILARDNLALWHGLSSLTYLMMALIASAWLTKVLCLVKSQ